MDEKTVYISGKPAVSVGLLTRYLPPIPQGIASTWLSDNLPRGGLVLDPFGAQPALAVEVARANNKILVSANNPIARFLIELSANPPKGEDLSAALAELASTRIGNERLEIHLQQLYMTTCVQCGQSVMAHAFIWERNSTSPFAKIYECDYCGDSGEHPVTQSDINLASSFSASSLHKMRVVERIARGGDPNRLHVEGALSVYLPRALYALVTLINRIESLLALQRNSQPNLVIRQRSLIALVLSALDKGNNLWTYPSGRARPKQLSVSPRFRENNIWLALEEAADLLGGMGSPVPFTIYPQFPEGNHGVTLYEGPFRELIQDISSSTEHRNLSFDAIITAFPRHNQAYWTLSALWAGWMWGHESIESFKSVFQRQRYDWAWYSSALNHVFNTLGDHLPSGIPIFGLIGEAEPHYLSASLVPAASTGFTLKGMAIRAESSIAQIRWEQDNNDDVRASGKTKNLEKLIVSNGIMLLKQRGEPAPYLTLYSNALRTIVDNFALAGGDPINPGDEYSHIHSLIDETLSFRNGFIRYGGSEKSPETSKFWHQDLLKPLSSLSDRVESMVYNYLMDNPGCSHFQIDEHICSKFPGLMTPSSDLIYTCIESYSEEDLLTKLTLRAQDKQTVRDPEILAMRSDLVALGDQLGFSALDEDAIIWNDANQNIRLVFFVIASAAIGEIVFNGKYQADKSIIVLPGARANLTLYKQRHNPYLREEVEIGWRFLKFRHLRHLMDSPALSPNNLNSLLGIDPLTESPAQLRLL
jgi:hypothetical protein